MAKGVQEIEMDYVVENFEHIAAGFGALVALASVVTKLTPTKKDDAFLAKVLEVFSLVKRKSSDASP